LNKEKYLELKNTLNQLTNKHAVSANF